MNEWLDIMLEEIDRKKRESEEAESESARRSGGRNQSKQLKKKDHEAIKRDRT
jgi:hypothetical protein